MDDLRLCCALLLWCVIIVVAGLETQTFVHWMSFLPWRQENIDFAVGLFWSSATAVCFGLAISWHWAQYFLDVLIREVCFQCRTSILVGGFPLVCADVYYRIICHNWLALGKYLVKQLSVLLLIVEFTAVAIADTSGGVIWTTE